MEGFFGTIIKYLVFITNLLIFLLGLVMFGYGVYALAADDGLSNLIDKKTYEDLTSTAPETSLVLVSAALVLVAFLGCCGAKKENRLMLFLYFVIMLLASLFAVFGSTLVFTHDLDQFKGPLEDSMKKFDVNATQENAKEITKAWNQVQQEFLCCGVDDFNDWSNSSMGTPFPDVDGNLVPASCCTGLTPDDEKTSDMCRKNPDNEEFATRLRGCFAQFEESYKKNERPVAVVTLIVLAVMFVNLVVLFAFALCINPHSGYEHV